ncbi:MAG: DUF2892 domain-containing protein [Balneolaceae bacterium]
MKKNSINKKIRRKNVGNTDSVIRAILGTVILLIGLYYGSWWGVAGLILIFTGAVSWCPIYKVLGIQTCSPDVEIEV